MSDYGQDTLLRLAAFEHVRKLGHIRDHLTAADLRPGFVFSGERIPLINPQRGIFKPRQMRFLLSIKTVFPKPGGKVWYDDQREDRDPHQHNADATRARIRVADGDGRRGRWQGRRPDARTRRIVRTAMTFLVCIKKKPFMDLC